MTASKTLKPNGNKNKKKVKRQATINQAAIEENVGDAHKFFVNNKKARFSRRLMEDTYGQQPNIQLRKSNSKAFKHD